MQDAPNSWVLEQTVLLGCSVVSREIQGFLKLSDMCAWITKLAEQSYIYFSGTTSYIYYMQYVHTDYGFICVLANMHGIKGGVG